LYKPEPESVHVRTLDPNDDRDFSYVVRGAGGYGERALLIEVDVERKSAGPNADPLIGAGSGLSALLKSHIPLI